MRVWLVAALLVGCTGGGSKGSDDDPSATSSVTTSDDVPGGGGGAGGLPTCPPMPVYEEVKEVDQWEQMEFQGYSVYYYVPENPVGLVHLFHGTGNSHTVAKQLEPIALLNEMIAAGIGFVATESQDRSAQARWDIGPFETNVDVPRVIALHEEILSLTDLDADDPVFTVGFSNGANFVAPATEGFLDAGYRVPAFAAHEAGLASTLSIPGMFHIAENDATASAAVIQGSADDVAATGAEVIVVDHLEIPLTPDRFLRIPTYTEELAQFAFDELVDRQVVDADGNRLVELDRLENVIDTLGEEMTAKRPDQITSQLRVVWATHRLNSEFGQELCELFVREAFE